MAPVDEKKRPETEVSASSSERRHLRAAAVWAAAVRARAEQLAGRAQAEREHHSSLGRGLRDRRHGCRGRGWDHRGRAGLPAVPLVVAAGARLRRGIGSHRGRDLRFAEGGGARGGARGSRLERVPEHREEPERLVCAACRRAAADRGDAERPACADRRPPAGVGRRARRRAEADREGVRRPSCLASVPPPPGRSRELAEGPVGRTGRGRDDRGRGRLRRRLAAHLAAAAAPRASTGRHWFPERSLSVLALA